MTEAPPQILAERKERFERVVFASNSLEARYHPNSNQDAIIIDKELGLAVLCDGIGGHSNGREAAQTAVREVQLAINAWEELNDEEVENTILPSLRGAVIHAHTAVTKIKGEKNSSHPGTTIDVVKLHEFTDGRLVAYIAHTGDSRVYLLHASGELEQITEDHDILSDLELRQQYSEVYQRDLTDSEISQIRKLLDHAESEADLPEGLERTLFRFRNVVRSHLGDPDYPPRIGLYQRGLISGDKLIMTSDGIHDNLTPDHIRDVSTQKFEADNLALGLVQEARQYADEHSSVPKSKLAVRGKQDDMTAVILAVK